MDTKTVLITGITGQDGSFLAELLLKKGYTVYGLVRRLSHPTFDSIKDIMNNVCLIDGDLSDYISVVNAIKKSEPDEIYNLGAQSFVATSWAQADYTSNISGMGALRVFEAARNVQDYLNKKIKIYQASSSEMYGLANGISPQNEDTVMVPRSPYGVAKLFAHGMARVYRESYDMFVTSGILFNHESQRRGIEFVSMKIANGVAKIKLGIDKDLKLGDIRSKRDFGYSPDYVEAMYLMMQRDVADDYVIATGESHSIREFCEIAFEHVGLNWEQFVKFDTNLYRPAEIFDLTGDYSKAKEKLGWESKTTFKELVRIMVDSEIEKLDRGIK
jgi:GDPmannose 4,6-dehydratase